jgi:homoserine dehydrogenase
MKRARLCVLGLGTVGRWLLRVLDSNGGQLADRYGFAPEVVAVANARDGLIHDPGGLDLSTVLGLADAGRPITEHGSVRGFADSLEGLDEIDFDVLAEVTSSPLPDGEPGATHMRRALRRGIAVATSNKWPVALHGGELTSLARESGVAFRAESTVMSGTPTVATLTAGIAGARPVALRGILNATVNFILTAIAGGREYADALAEAQRIGLAERDPCADVDGYDEVAKAMVLAALVFGRQLELGDVARRGISDLSPSELARGSSGEGPIRSVTTLEVSGPEGGTVTARIEPTLVGNGDPLAEVDGATNAVVCEAEPLGEVTVIGPGAGLALAGQGVLSDLIAIARSDPV